jgi:pyridoxine 5-phosphate synthase
MPKLGVNIEPVAVLRERGRIPEADPVTAAVMAELGGADMIVCPLREGFRPITEKDVKLLKAMIRSPIELQILPNEPMLALTLAVSPDFITLVPGKPDEVSGEVRLDAHAGFDDLARVFKEIRSAERRVGLLIEPDLAQVKAAASLAVDFAEFSLVRLAEMKLPSERSEFMEAFGTAVMAASKMGLGIGVSGGVDFRNAAEMCAKGKLHHVIAGGPLAARALWTGFEQAVRDMAGLVH